MIKFSINGGKCDGLIMSGGMQTVCSELGMLISAAYTQIRNANLAAANDFKRMIQITVRDDSPAWTVSGSSPGAGMCIVGVSPNKSEGGGR